MVGEEDCLYLNVYVPRVSERRESSEIRGEEEKKLRRGRILKILVLSLCNKSSSLVWIYESRSGNVVRDNVECCRRENSRKLSEQL